MALSEIEKLERRYAENPQGLTFAPLAEVHRKNGDVPRALELLKPGLAVHPDYIPASIVLGRCHFDLGELPAAEAAFTHVLSLDGENVIALKALADITERQYRFDEAERWLRTLLAIDRSNDEARDQLSRVEASRRQAEVASSITPEAVVSQEEAADSPPAEASGAITAGVGEAGQPAGAEPGQPEQAEGEAMDDLVSAEPRPLSLLAQPDEPSEVLGWVEDRDGALAGDATPLGLADLDLHVQPGSPEGIELEQPVSLAEPVEPISGLTGRDQEEAGETAPRASGGFQVELSEDIVLQSAGGSEFQMANASEELLSAPPPGRPADPLVPDLPSISSSHQMAEADRGTAAEPMTSQAAAAETPKEPTTGRDGGLAGEAWGGATQAGAASSRTDTPAPVQDAAGSPADPTAWPTIEAEGHVAEPGGAAGEPDQAIFAAEPAAPGHPVETPAGSSARGAARGAPSTWREPLADLPHPPQPDLIVTESMADLLLQQGHAAEALTVYRHLAARTSSDKFLDRIAELERGSSGAPQPSAGAAPAGPEPAVTAPPPRRSYSVQETQGQSVRAFLRGVLAGRLPPAPSSRVSPAAAAPREAQAGPEGAPTRPAHDSLSLSSVFGDDATPTPPAVSSAVPAAPAGGVSYDEFYGAAGASAPARTTRGPDPKSDDLDQFHAWLQNLKR